MTAKDEKATTPKKKLWYAVERQHCNTLGWNNKPGHVYYRHYVSLACSLEMQCMPVRLYVRAGDKTV